MFMCCGQIHKNTHWNPINGDDAEMSCTAAFINQSLDDQNEPSSVCWLLLTNVPFLLGPTNGLGLKAHGLDLMDKLKSICSLKILTWNKTYTILL